MRRRSRVDAARFGLGDGRSHRAVGRRGSGKPTAHYPARRYFPGGWTAGAWRPGICHFWAGNTRLTMALTAPFGAPDAGSATARRAER